jgi:hypothetical protein
MIRMALVLYYLNWEKEFIVVIDALQYGVGTVLYQVINGKKRYVEFTTKLLIEG